MMNHSCDPNIAFTVIIELVLLSCAFNWTNYDFLYVFAAVQGRKTLGCEIDHRCVTRR
jgi:hypothetical protein